MRILIGIIVVFGVFSFAQAKTKIKAQKHDQGHIEEMNDSSRFYAQKSKHNKKNMNAGSSEKDIYQWFQTYAEAVSLIEKRSFRPVDFSRFIQDSLKSAVSHIDAHSSFFSRESYKSVIESTSGEFSGIGVSVITKAPDDEALLVIDVVPSGPAEKAGIKGGDKIIEVNGSKLKGLSSDEVVNKLKGKVGSKVKLKVIRHKKPLSFKVVRDIIKDQTSISYLFPAQNVYYVSLKVFNEVACQQIEDILAIANQGKCKGLVLDLRRNPGGTVDSVVDIAGLFLNKGSVVVMTKNKKRELVKTYKTSRDPVLKNDVFIFILVDNFTASAAEILAGCLQYHSQKLDKNKKLMVFLVGTSTFGKGSVQELIPIKNGCALKITTMLYYLPEEISIQARGIKPDFTVKPKFVPADEIKWVNELYGKETALKNHITYQEVIGQASSKDKKKKKKNFWQRWFSNDQEDEQEEEENSVIENQEDDDEEDDEIPLNQSGLSRKKKKKKDWKREQREALALDIQVQACVNMINLLNGARKWNPELVKDRAQALNFLKENYLTDDVMKVEEVK